MQSDPIAVTVTIDGEPEAELLEVRPVWHTGQEVELHIGDDILVQCDRRELLGALNAGGDEFKVAA